MTVHRISSGGVVFRPAGATHEVALIRVSRADGHAWTLPKGWVERGEDLEQTAVREVREETGLRAKVLRKLGEITYEFYAKPDRSRVHKTVHVFLLECLGGDTAEHDDEVEEVRWFTLDEAVRTLTYKNEREMLEKAVSLIQGGGQTA
ncbi:MAG TPA: NUDIX hydrolase [Nitrospirales bacterium]|jgi:8-oxo-dGTP pyrophosphatase MutT (NUDIX family)|nr:NUDIX hydrolase [Nitrospirales bacterium]